MVGRLDTESARHCAGIGLFYDYIYFNRAPGFLTRNLERVLHLHELELGRGETCSSEQDTQGQGLDRNSWTIPTANMVKGQSDKDQLIFELKELKPLGSNGRVAKLGRSGVGKSGPFYHADVQISITIHDSRTGEIVQKMVDKGEIIGNETDQGKRFLVRSAKKHTFLKDDLVFPLSRQDPQQSVIDRYEAYISFNFDYFQDTYELLRHLGVKLPTPDDAPTRIVAKCKKLSRLPDSEEVVPLSRGPSFAKSQSVPLGIGLVVCMRWTTRGDSLLAASNRVLRNQQNIQAPDAKAPRKRVQITWILPQHTMVRLGPVCIHCGRKNFSKLSELRMHLSSLHDGLKYNYQKDREANDISYHTFRVELADRRSDTRASDRAPDPRDVQVLAPRRPFNRRKFLQGDDSWQKEARLDKTTGPAPSHNKKSTQSAKVSDAAPPKPKLPAEVEDRTAPRRKKFKVPKVAPGIVLFRTITKRPLVEGELVSESDDEVDTTWLELKQNKSTWMDNDLPPKAVEFVRKWDNYMKEEHLNGDLHLGDAIVRFVRQEGASLHAADLVSEFKQKLDELQEDKIITQEVHAWGLDFIDNLDPRKVVEPLRKRPRLAMPDDADGTGTPPRTPVSMISNPSQHGSPMSVNSSTPRDPHTGAGARQKGIGETVEQSSSPNAKGKGKAKAMDLRQITPQNTDSDGDVEMAGLNSLAEDLSIHHPENGVGNVQWAKCLCGKCADVSTNARKIIYCENPDCVRHCFHVDCVMRYWKLAAEPVRYEWVCQDCKKARNQ